MLILTLKENEKILIGDTITIKVVEIRGKQIRLGIEAPDDVLVLREKLAEKARGIKEHRRVGQGETPGAPPGRRPDPTRPRPLPAVPTPCTVPPTAPALAPEEGADRPTNGVDHHGGGRPGAPLSLPRAPVASGPPPSPGPLWTAYPWRPAITPDPGPTAPAPAPSPPPPRRGEPPPLCAHAHAPNRDRRPGNRPRRRSRGVE